MKACGKLRKNKWGFPKIRGTFLGVPIIRIIVFGGLYWGPLIWGNYQLRKTIVLKAGVSPGIYALPYHPPCTRRPPSSP